MSYFFRSHDEAELLKLVEWQKHMKTKSASKEKSVRPDICFYFLPADMTNPAFGTKNQLYKWVYRKFITHDKQIVLYTKTAEYLKNASSTAPGFFP